MSILQFVHDYILHIDDTLDQIITSYQLWTYLILFVVIFCETGLVVTPFLPGDSLLFAAGTLAARDGNPLNVGTIVLLLLAAAFIGDNTNYFVGTYLKHKIYQKNYKLIKREYLDKTHALYEKHGGKMLIIARFMPIIRTFAPFVAGVGEMTYKRFLMFCIVGNVLWVNLFSFGGYFFGNIPVVKKNFTLVIMLIIFISLLPTFMAVAKQLLKKLENKRNN